jgi:hypothetical protein
MADARGHEIGSRRAYPRSMQYITVAKYAVIVVSLSRFFFARSPNNTGSIFAKNKDYVKSRTPAGFGD